MPSVSFGLRGGRLEILLNFIIMLRFVSRRVQAVRQPLLRVSALSLAVSSMFASAAFAQTTNSEKTLPSVEVTGARFPSDPAFAPIGATVISSEEIRQSGITNVNEAIRRIGGVYGRQNLLGTSDFGLDLRGFGEQSGGNFVVVVDGVRYNENEQANALLSSIAIESVDRIEITRGGSSVLYGEGATGGVINIVTKRPALNSFHGSATVEVGTNGQRAVRGSLAKNWNGFSADANYSRERSNNYRHNNKATQENFSGGLQWAYGLGRIGVRLDLANADYRLPGPLTYAQYENDARQTKTPLDFGSYESNRLTVFGEHRFGAVEFAAELSHREKQDRIFNDYGGGYSSDRTVNSRVTQFSPRLRYIASGQNLKNELVVGTDWSQWDLHSATSTEIGSQKSQALYLRNELAFNGNARIAVGARHETFDKESTGGVNRYDKSQSLNAWDVQASYAVIEPVRIFAKAGQSYRVANIDDNRYVNDFGAPLKPQLSHDTEVGAVFGKGDNQLTVRWFQHLLTNEIVLNPFTYNNINLDPTKRRGIEVEGKARINENFTATASVQHVKATFRDGVNAGKEVALVPKNIVTARLNWLSGMHNANIGVQWVDTQRYGNDFNNTCASVIPSYTTVDARYAVRVSGWEFAVSGNNLLDEKYFTNAFGCKGNIYPDAGRALKFTARYDF